MQEILSCLLTGFRSIAGLTPLILIFLGVTMGILCGAIPGISPSTAVALLLPMTYTMTSTQALILLMAVYIGSNYGGSITAVCINTPGTPASTVTAFDGYPMTRQGRAGEAMGISLWASVLGGLIGTVILIFGAVPLSKLTLKFWPSEYFALCILGLTTVAAMGGKHWKQALVSVFLGLLLNTIGIDPVLGVKRFTFGSPKLFDGLALVPVLIGLFALGEAFSDLESGSAAASPSPGAYRFPPLRRMAPLKGTILRSSLVGCLVGIFPGAGGTIASFLCYDLEKRLSPHPERFGAGAPEGVAAAEASNSASVGGAMVPLLSLGIPGSSTAAVLIGALTIHNLSPGPDLFAKAPEMVYSMFASMLVANLFMIAAGILGSQLWLRIIRLPRTLLLPLIFTFSILGSYSVSRSLFDVAVCLGSGLLGWLMKRHGFPVAPVVLGMILGRNMELNFSQALMLDGPTVFFTRPLTLILLLLSLLTVLLPILFPRRNREDSSKIR